MPGKKQKFCNHFVTIAFIKCTISDYFSKKDEQCEFIKQDTTHVPSSNTFTKLINVGYMTFLSDSMCLLKFSEVPKGQIFMDV